MGCALGKPAGAGARHRRRDNTANANGGNNAVEVREKQEAEAPTAGELPGNIPAPVSLLLPRLNSLGPTQQSWPPWLMEVAGDAIRDWTPRRANTFEKLAKIGKGTYSNVYKAKDLVTGKIVALKKVRIDNLDAESVKFMAREILVLRKLDHPNVIKLEGLVTSRISSSLYLVFEYMEHDLAGLIAGLGVKFSLPQVKCYMKQLLSGLEHCHSRGVLHRDIKGSNLLIDDEGILKIADFGLATFYDSKQKHPMTSRVVTLWYRPPELLLGATFYGVGVDLWSAGCILAELLAGRPIMPGRTEVEQLHKIFKLCGSPSEEYWKKYRLPNATLFKPQQPYKRRISEAFAVFPPSSLPLIGSLLAIDPDDRGTTSSALISEFFTTEPYACEPSSLPKYPPSKELDVKLRDEEARRQRALSGKSNAVDGARQSRARERGYSIPAPEANAEIQTNIDRLRVVTNGNGKSKSEKFPPPHEDGAVGYPGDGSNKGAVSFGTTEKTSFSSILSNSIHSKSVGSYAGSSHKRRKSNEADSRISSWKLMRSSFKPSTTSPERLARERRREERRAAENSMIDNMSNEKARHIFNLDLDLDNDVGFHFVRKCYKKIIKALTTVWGAHISKHESDLDTHLENVKSAYEKGGRDFSEIDPGDIMFEDYLPTQYGRLKAYEDRLEYWDRLTTRANRCCAPRVQPLGPQRPASYYTPADYGLEDDD